MGILDRKYSRREEEEPPSLEGLLRNRWVWIGLAILIVIIIVVSVLTASKPRSLDEGSRLVNINTATAVELESLPGIGPSLAQFVIAGRPYKSIDDLERVHGIGPRQVEQLRPFLTATGSAQSIQRFPIWDRITDAVARLDKLVLAATGTGLVAGLYFLVRWWRGRAQRLWNARIRSSFEEAERRRWEGHRREKR